MVAKPPGTCTPRRVRELIISPREAFLPPTFSTSCMPSCSNGMTNAFKGAPEVPRGRLPWARRAVKHCGPRRLKTRKYAQAVSRRTVFFVSDQTGVTAETLGHSLMTQFEGLEFRAGDFAICV